MHAEDSRLNLPKSICYDCVGEVYLSFEIFSSGSPTACSYCTAVAETISLEELADRVESAFLDHYVRTSNEPEEYERALLADKESDYDWEREGTLVLYAIQESAGLSEKALRTYLRSFQSAMPAIAMTILGRSRISIRIRTTKKPLKQVQTGMKNGGSSSERSRRKRVSSIGMQRAFWMSFFKGWIN